MASTAMSVVYVKMTPADRAALDQLTAESGAAVGRPVSMSDVVRTLVREAAARGKPVRVRR